MTPERIQSYRRAFYLDRPVDAKDVAMVTMLEEIERLQRGLAKSRADLASVQNEFKGWAVQLSKANEELHQMDALKAELAEQVDSLISEVTSMKCAHVHPSIRWTSKQMWNYVMGRDVSAATVAEVTHAIEAKEAELIRLRSQVEQKETEVRTYYSMSQGQTTELTRLREALTPIRAAIVRTLGGMEAGSAIWGKSQYDKGWSNGVTAALTAFDTEVKKAALHPSPSKPEDV